MRKILLTVLLSAALVIPTSFLLMTEDSAGSETHAIAVVIADHTNNYHTPLDDPQIEQALKPLYRAGGYLSFISGEGEPRVLGSASIPSPPNPTEEALKRRYEDENGPFAFMRSLDTTPISEEVDYLSAIKLAVATLHSEEAMACDTRTLYLINASGLSTEGEYIDFTKGILECDYDVLVERMCADGALPDLSLGDIAVVWSGLGKTASPQQDIPSKDIKRMNELWEKVLIASGSGSIEFIDSLPGSLVNTVETHPYVTTIPFAPVELIDKPVQFAENLLGFLPWKAEYREGNEIARANLRPYAEALMRSGQKVIILGCAYTDGEGDYIELGMDRALRVRDDLVAMGVPADQLTVVSAGCTGTQVMVGDEIYDFFDWDQPEYSRSVWLIPKDKGEDILARFVSL